MDIEPQVRLSMFAHLTRLARIHGDELSHSVLKFGFMFEGQKIHLVSAQGIFKPKILQFPLTITTAPNGPYKDHLPEIGPLLYRYRGNNPSHRDNVGLRECMKRKLPLAYFFGFAKGLYVSLWPVYVIADDPARLTFSVTLEDVEFSQPAASGVGTIAENREIRREYMMSTVRRRVHQSAFRERVLKAYRTRCALCQIRHRELLDAAHIIGDARPDGVATVSNGLSLCKIHHAAFDSNIVGIRPDYVVEVPRKILDEKDGPMLRHGLQGLHRSTIQIPRNPVERPDPERLEKRYEDFRSSTG